MKLLLEVAFRIQQLTNHEEAETCLALNAKDAIQNKYKSSVIVICRGTDVLYLLYHLGCTKYEVWMMSGTLISSVHYFIETRY